MDETAEIIDSSEMEILSEFQSEITEDEEFATPYRLGVLNNNLIVTAQNTIAYKPQGKKIPEDADEKTKIAVEKNIKRNWWRGRLVFELKNFEGVLARLEEIYGERPAREIDLNELDIINGKDKIAVSKMSVMPNNVGQPINSVQLTNYRKVDMDDYVSSGWHLYVTPETGLKLMDEIKRIRPVVENKLKN